VTGELESFDAREADTADTQQGGRANGLTPSSCEALSQEALTAAREAYEAAQAQLLSSFESWRRAQPDCWRQYRENAEFWHAVREGRAGFGWGGLGLSGIGEGGGGRGEGIGLGAASEVSATNNQVVGVDEADLFKATPQYLYLATSNRLRVVSTQSHRIVGSVALPGEARSLLLEGRYAVVFSALGTATSSRCTYAYDCEAVGDGTSTTATVIDVADADAPRVVRRLDFSGSLLAGRKVGDVVHLVVGDDIAERPMNFHYEVLERLDTCGVREETARATLARLQQANRWELERISKVALPTLREGGKTVNLCERVYRDGKSDQRSYTTLASFSLVTPRAPVHTVTVRSRPGIVYASAENLYLAVHGAGLQPTLGRRDVQDATELHRFRLGKRAEEVTYAASARIRGHLLNQFAMDEWNGTLRVATTYGKVPQPDTSNEVWTLAPRGDHGLIPLARLSGIAPQEDLRAIRFDGDRGYLVTFKKTDPLFTLDLQDGRAPRVLGELKIPGFSTYLHRLDPTHLMSIGFDADDHGGFAYFNGLLLQLFDVTDPVNPRLVARETLGTRGSASEAATDHLAFNYLPQRGLLAIPATLCEGGGDGNYGSRLTFSGLVLFKVDPRSGFSKLGGIDHGGRGQSCQTWWSQSKSQVKRSVFIDDQVFSIALDRIRVQRLGSLDREPTTVLIR